MNGILSSLITGGTTHFVFISGFLFHHIYYVKKRTHTFLRDKVKRLIIPYILLSIAPIIVKLLQQPEFWNSYYDFSNSSIFVKYLLSTAFFYISGSHLVAYWYIPFIICLFLFYRLHIRFIELKPRHQLLLLGFLFIISLFVHRPLTLLGAPQSVVYFTAPYLLGVFCSKHKEDIYTKLKGKEFVLAISVLGLAIFQTFLGDYGSYEKEAFTYGGIDIMLIQKSIFCIFFMVFLYRFEHVKNKFINLLANTSFAIFFLHGYVLRALSLLKSHFEVTIEYPWAGILILTIAIVLFGMLVAIIIKKISPKYSKYLTGY